LLKHALHKGAFFETGSFVFLVLCCLIASNIHSMSAFWLW